MLEKRQDYLRKNVNSRRDGFVNFRSGGYYLTYLRYLTCEIPISTGAATNQLRQIVTIECLGHIEGYPLYAQLLILYRKVTI